MNIGKEVEVWLRSTNELMVSGTLIVCTDEKVVVSGSLGKDYHILWSDILMIGIQR